MAGHVVIKSSRFGMVLYLDPDCAFEELIAELREKFRAHADFWGSVQLVLSLEGRELTGAQELAVINAVTESTGIEILSLLDRDADRIGRCEKLLNDRLMELSARTGRFFRGDLAAGEVLESEGGIVILGSVFPGARVTARGSIVVLGELRGSAAAGAAGNTEAVIAAYDMAPGLLRIAQAAKKPCAKPRRFQGGPSLAFWKEGTVCVRPLCGASPNLV